MRVAISCDEYCAKVGNKYYLRDFGQVLVKRYLNVFDKVRLIVRTFEKDNVVSCGKFKYEVTDKRVEIYPIPFFQGPVQYLKCYVKVQKAVKNSLDGCNLAILRLPSTVGFSVQNVAHKKKIPYALELVYDCKDSYQQNAGLTKLLWWRMHRKQLSACRGAIGIAPVTANYLQKHYPPKNEDVIMSHYSSVEMNDSFYHQPRSFPIKDFLTIVHVANQVQFKGRKGHEDVISAIKILKDNGLRINIVFVGEDYQDGISKLTRFADNLGVKENISFTGFLPSEKMREVLLNSDIAVLPTKAEGLPRVIIEAMALGLPCITTNVSGNPELIDSEFLFDFGNVAAISRMIKLLATHRVIYEQTSKNNYTRSLEYSKNVLDKRRTDFFKSLKQKVNNI